MSGKREWTMENEENPEAPVDPGFGSRGYTEQDYEGHRAHTMFFGVHVPNRRSHRRHKGSQKQTSGKGLNDTEKPTTPPAQRVQFILGEEVEPDGGAAVETHPLFSEMEELVKDGDEIEWKETARWVKFEEDVEEGGNRWSKPHVATLSLHSLFELRSYILNGSIMLDMEATNLEQVADLVCENMVNNGALSGDTREKVRDALLRRHRHQHEQARKNHMAKLPLIRSLADIGKNHSATKSFFRAPPPPTSVSCNVLPNTSEPFLTVNYKQSSLGTKDQRGAYTSVPSGETIATSPSSISMQRNSSSGDLEEKHKTNTNFMRKIPPGAEASNILVGEVDFLDKSLAAFVRLNQAYILGDLTEVPVPTRFIFILLGPPGSQSGFHEVGRVMATLMSDEVFHEVAYRAKKRDHLIAGIDEFLDAVTVLPPGEWDPSIRIEPPASVPSQEVRKKPDKQNKKEEINEEELEQRLREESGLSRTGKWFGGLVNDIKRKKPFYLSDFKDALSLQCVASWIFLYFACLSPIITFGGLLGQATGNNIAAMESLLSGFVCGVGYGFFSGQPLTILGSTGPVLVFETIVYDFCQKVGWDYISFRMWIGIWIAAILVLLVAIDASAFVCYITRFTEENFACLIAFIFIYKAIENVLKIGKDHPLNMGQMYDCSCVPPGEDAKSIYKIHEVSSMGKDYCLSINGTLIGLDCDKPGFVSDVFLMSIILFTGTYIISVVLKDFKNALFFPACVRQVVSDFAVIIAIFTMTLFDFVTKVPTPKLEVPDKLKPTLPDRGWIIMPFHEKNPMYTCILAVLPALLGTILIFMDQQITAVIINRKENKLKKGCGYHLDLFVLAGLILICSVMGLPWFVAATVLSINHVNSLKVESESAAPGEKPQFLGVREQRVTHIMIFVTIGCSVMLTPLLSHIPMPVLFGVFLYMGAASLKGLQFFDRLLIMLMPVKYQPDFMFLRQVPIKRVHLFTLIQLACLVTLWLIKSFSTTSILFPLMLVIMIAIRKSLDFVFTRRELKILDDIMPEMVRRANVEDLHNLDPEDGNNKEAESKLNTSTSNGNLTSSINISEEVNKTTIWKQVNDGKLFFTRKFKEKQEKGSSDKSDKKDKALDMIKEVADTDNEKRKISSVSQV